MQKVVSAILLEQIENFDQEIVGKNFPIETFKFETPQIVHQTQKLDCVGQRGYLLEIILGPRSASKSHLL